jgi:hypothetical protein
VEGALYEGEYCNTIDQFLNSHKIQAIKIPWQYAQLHMVSLLPTKFRIIWPSGFWEEFKKSASQKQESPVVAIFFNG